MEPTTHPLYSSFKWSEEGRDVEQLRGRYFSYPTPFKMLEIQLVNTVQIDSLSLCGISPGKETSA